MKDESKQRLELQKMMVKRAEGNFNAAKSSFSGMIDFRGTQEFKEEVCKTLKEALACDYKELASVFATSICVPHGYFLGDPMYTSVQALFKSAIELQYEKNVLETALIFFEE